MNELMSVDISPPGKRLLHLQSGTASEESRGVLVGGNRLHNQQLPFSQFSSFFGTTPGSGASGPHHQRPTDRRSSKSRFWQEERQTRRNGRMSVLIARCHQLVSSNCSNLGARSLRFNLVKWGSFEIGDETASLLGHFWMLTEWFLVKWCNNCNQL